MADTNGTAIVDGKPYYGPIGETSTQILLEKTFMASGYLTGVGFGIQLVVYGACLRNLLRRSAKNTFTYFLMGYTTLLCLLNGVWSATSAFGLQLTYIDNRNFPNGGSFAFLQVEFSDPSQVVAITAYIVANVMADALLLWRCRVIWSASLGPKVDSIMVVPVLMLLCSIAMAILFAFETSSPAGFFSKITTSFALPYFAMSLSLNILLTLMIVLRLAAYRQKGRYIFGQAYGEHYGSISTMFIESAALYTICSILLLATYATGHPINQIWLGISPAVQEISNYLIIYRVVQGNAWNTNTLGSGAVHSTMVFDSGTFQISRSHVTDTTATKATTTLEIPLQGMEDANKSGVALTVTPDEGREPSLKWAIHEDV